MLNESIQLPTDEERQAHDLRTRQGLKDGRIAELLNISRETVNRRIRRFQHKERQLRLACASGQSCTLLEMALG